MGISNATGVRDICKFFLYSCGGFNTPTLCVVTKGIKADCNHLMRTTYPDACVGVVDFYEIYDIKHSDAGQDRYNGFGYVEKSGLSIVQVVYTETGRIHIISARPATAQERKMYYDRLRRIYHQM